MLSKRQPDVPRYLHALGSITAWHAYIRSDGSPLYRRTLRGFVLTPVYRLLTWGRWHLGRGPLCGDEHCFLAEHWPGGRVLFP